MELELVDPRPCREYRIKTLHCNLDDAKTLDCSNMPYGVHQHVAYVTVTKTP